MHESTHYIDTPADFAPVIDLLLALPAVDDRARVITLAGDLGAGKTTFTQQLAARLGIVEPVVSPTFVVMKSYEVPEGGAPGGQNPSGFAHLVHIDAYRFEDPSEAIPLRLSEVFATPNTIVCVEWPERIAEIIPADAIAINLTIESGERRLVTVSY